MSNLFQQYNLNPAMTPVRLVANSNQSGTYFNGTNNNGVGATFTYGTGVLTIDSVVAHVGDRILLVGQTAAAQNGIYVVNVAGAVGVSAVLQRAADLQSIEQLHTGFYVSVQGGTALGGGIWSLVEPKPAVLGLNNLVFANTGIESSGTFLVASNNLSDLTSVPAALANLGFGNGPVMQSASVVLTQAQVQGMYAAPVQIVAAPGAGKMLVPVQMSLYTNFQTTAFAGGGVGILQYLATVHGAGTNSLAATIPAAEITAAASQVYNLGASVATVLTGTTNAGLFLSNATAAFTGGSASSTVTVNVEYYTINALV